MQKNTDSYSPLKKRILLFIELMGIREAQFEADCYQRPGYVREIGESIQPEKVKWISLGFPKLNSSWLLTGKGEMILNSPAVIEAKIATLRAQIE